MSRRRRTLLFVLIFLSYWRCYKTATATRIAPWCEKRPFTQENIVSNQIKPGRLPVAEFSPNFKAPTVIAANPVLNAAPYVSPSFSGTPCSSSTTELISAAQRLLASTQRPIYNEVIPQPARPEPPLIPLEPPLLEVPNEIQPWPNTPISNTQPYTPYSLASLEYFPVESSPLEPQLPLETLPSSPQFALGSQLLMPVETVSSSPQFSFGSQLPISAEPLQLSPQWALEPQSPIPIETLPISPHLSLGLQFPTLAGSNGQISPQWPLGSQSSMPLETVSSSPQFTFGTQLPISAEPLQISSQWALESQSPIPAEFLPISPQLTLGPQYPIPVEPLQISPQWSLSPDLGTVYQMQLDYGGLDQNNLSFDLPLGPILPLDLMPQTVPEVINDDYGQNTVSYQAPIRVQVPPMSTQPYIAVATPAASLPQNLQMEPIVLEYKPDYNTEYNTQIANVAPMFESLCVSSDCPSIVETMPTDSQQLPLSFQINMPPPPEQPIIMIQIPNSAPVIQDYYVPPLSPIANDPPPPVIVLERSRSSLKSLLPILLLSMCDCGCGNNRGNCYACNNIPIPYPIPIPTSNPIILGKGKKKKPASEPDPESGDEE